MMNLLTITTSIMTLHASLNSWVTHVCICSQLYCAGKRSNSLAVHHTNWKTHDHFEMFM